AAIYDGTARCWGFNSDGQVGDGTLVNPRLVPVAVAFLALTILSARKVSAGVSHTCATIFDGSVKCWGNNKYRQLGTGGWVSPLLPVTVPGVDNAIDVSAGDYHTCALRGTGVPVCWGFGHSGELGDGSSMDSPTPVEVVGLTDAIALSSGGYHTCALST